jgi:hypothetical protein
MDPAIESLTSRSRFGSSTGRDCRRGIKRLARNDCREMTGWNGARDDPERQDLPLAPLFWGEGGGELTETVKERVYRVGSAARQRRPLTSQTAMLVSDISVPGERACLAVVQPTRVSEPSGRRIDDGATRARGDHRLRRVVFQGSAEKWMLMKFSDFVEERLSSRQRLRGRARRHRIGIRQGHFAGIKLAMAVSLEPAVFDLLRIPELGDVNRGMDEQDVRVSPRAHCARFDDSGVFEDLHPFAPRPHAAVASVTSGKRVILVRRHLHDTFAKMPRE